jgi:hypothetical protein
VSETSNCKSGQQPCAEVRSAYSRHTQTEGNVFEFRLCILPIVSHASSLAPSNTVRNSDCYSTGNHPMYAVSPFQLNLLCLQPNTCVKARPPNVCYQVRLWVEFRSMLAVSASQEGAHIRANLPSKSPAIPTPRAQSSLMPLQCVGVVCRHSVRGSLEMPLVSFARVFSLGPTFLQGPWWDSISWCKVSKDLSAPQYTGVWWVCGGWGWGAPGRVLSPKQQCCCICLLQ